MQLAKKLVARPPLVYAGERDLCHLGTCPHSVNRCYGIYFCVTKCISIYSMKIAICYTSCIRSLRCLSRWEKAYSKLE